MFSWFKRKPKPAPEVEPKLTEAYKLVCEAYRLFELAGFIMTDTQDWKRLPDARSRDAVAKFYINAETQLRYTKDELTLTMQRLPGVKIIRKGSK